MKLIAAVLAAVAGGQVLACDDHHGQCEIEAWRYHTNTITGTLTIEGTTTCASGSASIRLYDGETYLGNADGWIEGHALSALAVNIPPVNNLEMKYSIDPGM